MKTTTLFLILFLTGLGLWAQTPPAARVPVAPASAQSDANVTTDANSSGGAEEVAGITYNFTSTTIDELLDQIYSPLVGRTLLRAPGLPLTTPIVLKTMTPLTKAEAIEALQAVLSMNGVVIENMGDKFAKVLPLAEAGTGGEKIDTNDVSQLPDMGKFVTRIVHLNYLKPTEMQGILAPFAKSANAILPFDDNGILILRDNVENVKRMLEMIAQVDLAGSESEIISEVIPIKYALAPDIASALTSLGGSSANAVSIGAAPTTTTGGNGLARPGGIGGTPGGTYQPNGLQGSQPRAPGATPNGTPSSTTPFQQRLQTLVNRATAGSGGQEPIQIFGQTKIIADQRSNSLLIFATRQDMDTITNIIAKLDVLLSQVLIESAIIDVDLNKSLNAGVSVAQNPASLGGSVVGGGGSINGGPSFINFLQQNSTYANGTNSSGILGNALSSGLSYIGNIGPTWDVALQAAADDSSATVIQRPRIQTSQAKAASFFVGQTVPYVTGSTYGSAYGNSPSYSQLSVGVELDVTPFINPDGLVVMDINQEIDDISGSTPIEGVGNIPNTDKRTLSSEIAVKDKDTVMLGGFVRSENDKDKNGIPFLQDIPLIGNLFTSRTDKKDRTETIVLIRPTVLRTPDVAAAQAVAEQKRLPGITRAIAEDAEDERKQVAAEAKAEANDAQKSAKPDNVFLPLRPDGTLDTNQVAPSNP